MAWLKTDFDRISFLSIPDPPQGHYREDEQPAKQEYNTGTREEYLKGRFFPASSANSESLIDVQENGADKEESGPGDEVLEQVTDAGFALFGADEHDNGVIGGRVYVHLFSLLGVPRLGYLHHASILEVVEMIGRVLEGDVETRGELGCGSRIVVNRSHDPSGRLRRKSIKHDRYRIVVQTENLYLTILLARHVIRGG